LAHVSQERDRGAGGDLDAAQKAMAGNPWKVHGVLPDNPLRLIPRVGSPAIELSDPTKVIDKIAGSK
jgi:hypothetical protein